MWKLSAGSLFLLLGQLPSGLAAQVDRPDPVVVLRGIETGSTARVRWGGIRLRGTVWGVEGDVLRLGVDSVLVEIPALEILLLETRRTGSVEGARALGIVGAIVGGVGTALYSSAVCDVPSCGVNVPITLIGAALLGGMGALSGAVLGSFVPKWERNIP